MRDCELSIVLPAYREADSLDLLLPRIQMCAGRLTPQYEILVIDALTPIDGTGEICQKHGVRHQFRSGGNTYGDAVRTGIRESAGRFVVFMDADGSHDPQDLESLWSRRRESTVVIGSRYMRGGHTENPAILVLMSRTLNLVYRLVLGLRTGDVSNSFRLYDGGPLRALALECSNFDIVEEMLARLVWGPARVSILEVPVTFQRRKAGESKRNLVTFAASYVRSLARLRKLRAEARHG